MALDQAVGTAGRAVSPLSQPGAGTSDLRAVLESDISVLQSCLAPRAWCSLEGK